MKKIVINDWVRSGFYIFTVLCFMLVVSCGGNSETDYVNEIEAAENAVGQPGLDDNLVEPVNDVDPEEEEDGLVSEPNPEEEEGKLIIGADPGEGVDVEPNPGDTEVEEDTLSLEVE